MVGRSMAGRSMVVRCARAAALALGLAGAADAQVVETPVPFDSAGRITVITPPLAARLGLAPPTWVVGGDYREARLYAQPDGNFVLIAFRPSGALERYALTPPELDVLRAAITIAAGTARARAGADRSNVISEPAGFAFTRNQLILGLTVYGPAAAALLAESSGSAAAGSYFLVAGGTFFAAAQYARSHPVSRAQNALGTHGATRGALIGGGTATIFDLETEGTALSALAGALGGTVFGLRAASGMTDGEAQASGFVADAAALTTFGVVGATDPDYRREKETIAAAIATGVAGYYVGTRYGGRRAYHVTDGDVLTLYTTGALGALTGLAATVDASNDRATFGATTAGFLAGVFAGDRLLVRRYDHTAAEGRLFAVGATAGGLMGLGMALATEADDATAVTALVALGAMGGAGLTTNIMAPDRDSGRLASAAPGGGGGYIGRESTRRAAHVQLVPASLGLLALRRPGAHPLVSVTF